MRSPRLRRGAACAVQDLREMAGRQARKLGQLFLRQILAAHQFIDLLGPDSDAWASPPHAHKPTFSRPSCQPSSAAARASCWNRRTIMRHMARWGIPSLAPSLPSLFLPPCGVYAPFANASLAQLRECQFVALETVARLAKQRPVIHVVSAA